MRKPYVYKGFYNKRVVGDYIITSKINTIFWWEIWSFFNYNIELEKINNTVWSSYKLYRLSIWNNWHILEERICLFLTIIYFLTI